MINIINKMLLTLMIYVLIACKVNASCKIDSSETDHQSSSRIVYLCVDGPDLLGTIDSMIKAGQLNEWRYVCEHSLWTNEGSSINPPTSVPNWSANFYGAHPTFWESTKDLFSKGSQYDPQRYLKKGYKDWISMLCQNLPDQSAVLISQWDDLRKMLPDSSPHLEYTHTSNDDESYTKTIEAMKNPKYNLVVGYFMDFDAISHESGSDSEQFKAYAIKFSGWLKEIVSNLRDEDIFVMGSDHARDKISLGCLAKRNYTHKQILTGDVKRIFTLFGIGKELRFPTDGKPYSFSEEFKPSILNGGDISIADVKPTLLKIRGIQDVDDENVKCCNWWNTNKKGREIKQVVEKFTKE